MSCFCFLSPSPCTEATRAAGLFHYSTAAPRRFCRHPLFPLPLRLSLIFPPQSQKQPQRLPLSPPPPPPPPQLHLLICSPSSSPPLPGCRTGRYLREAAGSSLAQLGVNKHFDCQAPPPHAAFTAAPFLPLPPAAGDSGVSKNGKVRERRVKSAWVTRRKPDGFRRRFSGPE